MKKDQLLQLKNKEFAFECLRTLIKHGRQKDIYMLTDPEYCKRRFDMNYPILQAVSSYGSIPRDHFLDAAGNRRYYPDVITAFGMRYIVCNDWYYNNKTNKRDTRTDFVNWVTTQ